MAGPFYVELAGNDGNAGTSMGAGNAWLTIGKAATTLAAGEICYVRGAETHTQAADINFTNDGTPNNQITIQGCYDGVTDPWGDGAVARPIVDFNGGDYHFYFSSDNFWTLKGFDIKNGSNINIQLISSYGVIIEDCLIHDSASWGVRSSGDSKLIDCEFYDCDSICIYASGIISIDGCVLNKTKAAGAGDYGLYVSGGTVFIKNTTFGVTSEFGIDVYAYLAAKIYLRNCILDSTTPVLIGSLPWPGNIARSEDDGQVFGAFTEWSALGTITKDTGETPPGGSGWAYKCIPNAYVGADWPLYLGGNEFEGFPVYLDGTEQTITVKMKCLDANWSLGGGTGGRPDNSELYIEVEYHNAATTLTTAVSTEACADDTYTSFTVTITPSAAGKATVTPILKLYEASAPVYVDPVVTIT